MIYSHEKFNALLKSTISNIEKLSELKGGEYAGDTDRLANFRRNGEALELPMETIWRIYAAKHWDAIGQYIVDLQTGKKRERLEGIDGRVDDLIVYLLLFKAMIDEKNSKPTIIHEFPPITEPGWIKFQYTIVVKLPVGMVDIVEEAGRVLRNRPAATVAWPLVTWWRPSNA